MSSDPNEPYVITPSKLTFYETNGFLILNDVLSPTAAEQLQYWSKEVHSWPNVPGRHMAYTETLRDGSIGICRTENYANLWVWVERTKESSED